jgi:hypothetical protein
LKLKIFSISIVLLFLVLGFRIYNRNIANVSYDAGDAPKIYGKPVHFMPETGPFLGKLRGDDDSKSFDYCDFANFDDTTGANDEDAFEINHSILQNNKSLSIFLTDIEAIENSYELKIPISNGADGDPVRGWIDFDGNGKFDDMERAEGIAKEGFSFVELSWSLPENLQPSMTYARFRTCKKVYEEQINSPTAAATSGEVEDYIVRVIKPVKNSEELKNYIDFSLLPRTDNIDATKEALKKIKIGEVDVSFQFSGVNPEILGINNFHEASILGLRIGHDSLDATPQNPILTKMTFSKAVENLSFKLTDLDAGDRMKIVGYNKGAIVNCTIKNLTENFYYNYNLVNQEIFGAGDLDAGNDTIIPSSLDMGVEVIFLGFIDSVKLLYSDDMLGSSGTVTLCDISCRKMNFPPFKLNALTASEEEQNIVIKWVYSSTAYVKSYALERSFNGIEYVVLAKGDCDPNTLIYNYIDSEIPMGQLSCYYRLSTIEIDNHESYSTPTRLKRKQVSGISGFVFPSQTFFNEITMQVLLDFPGKSGMIIYDYMGKVKKKLAFENLQAGQKVTIKELDNFESGNYYFELLYNNQKFLQSGNK